jgi:hypothetical protein
VKPSVGRIVNYTNLGDRDGRYPPEAQAAIITKVVDIFALSPPLLQEDDENRYKVSLRVFYEMGDFAMINVPFTTEAPVSEGARGKWAWPPRV